MRHKNISWTAAEYAMLQGAVRTYPGLQSLLDKMDAARNGKSAKEKWPFSVMRAKQLAFDVLGDRLKMNPAQTPAWYAKMGRALADGGVTTNLFKKACRAAARSWKGKIYFDTLVHSVGKLVAMDSPGRVGVKQFGGFAEPATTPRDQLELKTPDDLPF